MSDSRIPKATFYAELPSGTRPNCRPLLRFKDNLKANLLSTGIDPTTWEDLAGNRSKSRKACSTGLQHFEEAHIVNAVEKRSRRKGSTSQSIPAAESSDTRPFTFDDCGRQYTARIGLVGHTKIHRKENGTGAHTSSPTGDSIIINKLINTSWILASYPCNTGGPLMVGPLLPKYWRPWLLRP